MPIQTELIRIGNSRGVRIQKPIIEECRLGNKVELRVQNDCLIISSARRPRAGWEELFRAAGPSVHDEALLEPLQANDFDRKEWNW